MSNNDEVLAGVKKDKAMTFAKYIGDAIKNANEKSSIADVYEDVYKMGEKDKLTGNEMFVLGMLTNNALEKKKESMEMASMLVSMFRGSRRRGDNDL